MQLDPDAITWLFLDMNSFFASVEQQECPAYIGKPLIVVPSMTDATCAIAASYEAKAYGIKTGTNVGDARAKCPHLICVPARHDVYLRYHEMMLSTVVRHTPITKVCSIDELASKLPPLKANAESATKVALAIKADMRAQIGEAVTCSIGLSGNIFLSKMATDLQKPDGLVVLPPRDAYQRLRPLRLTDLTGIGANMERRLNKCGIWTMEQLWQCSARQLRGIWRSVEGEKFWYRLRGYDIPDTPTQTSIVGHSRVLEPRFRDPDQARVILSQLTEKACNRMRRKGYAAKVMSIGLREVTGRKYGAETSFSPPCTDNIVCVRAMHALYDRVLQSQNVQRLKKVSVTFSRLTEQERIHPDLFHDYMDAPAPASPPRPAPASAHTASAAAAQAARFRMPHPRHGGLYHRPFYDEDGAEKPQHPSVPISPVLPREADTHSLQTQHYDDEDCTGSVPPAGYEPPVPSLKHSTSSVPRARAQTPQELRRRHQRLSRSIDHIIKTFGSDSIHFGCTPEAKSKYVGTKIAFNRIPDQEEFW